MKHTSLHDRMKGAYENAYRIYLPRRVPVIIRCDMKAGHTFTRGLDKPFDSFFMNAMEETALKMVEEIEGCVFAYTQSDEISLLLKNNQTIKTEPWFDNNLNKMVSISASMATLYFNKIFKNMVSLYVDNFGTKDEAHVKARDKDALFDSRAFILSDDEVNNYFLDRQNDATRNSILGCAQVILGKKTSMGFKTDELQELMFNKNGFNWNSLPADKKRGCAIVYQDKQIVGKNGTIVNRRKATIDRNIPVFSQDTDYINSIVYSKD